MRIWPIATLALLLSACGSKTEQTAPAPKKAAATALVQPLISDDAVAAVLESPGKPLAQLRFVLATRPVAGQAFRLQLLASAAAAVPPLHLTAESDALKIDPASVVLTLREAGTGGALQFSASQDFALIAAQEGLAELTVHLVTDGDTPETLYVIPVMIGNAGPAGAAGTPASDKPDPAAATNHAQPQKG